MRVEERRKKAPHSATHVRHDSNEAASSARRNGTGGSSGLHALTKQSDSDFSSTCYGVMREGKASLHQQVAARNVPRPDICLHMAYTPPSIPSAPKSLRSCASAMAKCLHSSGTPGWVRCQSCNVVECFARRQYRNRSGCRTYTHVRIRRI